jgi:competence protein ComEC
LFLFFNLNSIKDRNEFEIDFIDVGQGNSTLIKYKNLTFLIDSGKELYARKNFYEEVSFFKKDIDFVFATHYDFDHVGNLLDYFKKYNIFYFFRNGKQSKAPIFNELAELSNKENIKNMDLVADDVLKIDNNLQIKILFPDAEINNNSMKDNDSSLVLQIFFRDKIFLITGDAPKKIEE